MQPRAALRALSFPADDGKLSMSVLSVPPLDASALSGASVRSGARNSHLFSGSTDSSLLEAPRALPPAAYLQPPAGLWHPIAVAPSVSAAALEPLPPSPRAGGGGGGGGAQAAAQRGGAGPQRVLTPYGRQLKRAGLLHSSTASAGGSAAGAGAFSLEASYSDAHGA